MRCRTLPPSGVGPNTGGNLSTTSESLPSSSMDDDWVLHHSSTTHNVENTTTGSSLGGDLGNKLVTPPFGPKEGRDSGLMSSFVLEPAVPETKSSSALTVPQSPARRISLFNAPSAAPAVSKRAAASASGGRVRSGSLSTYPSGPSHGFSHLNKPLMGSTGPRKNKKTVVVHSAKVRLRMFE